MTRKLKEKQKTVFIHAKYVCERSKTDASKIAYYFQKNGYKIINNPKNADYIIFNSCGYSNPIAEKCLKEILNLQKYSGELIVIGGLLDSDKDKFLSIFSGKALSHKDLEKLDSFFPENTFSFNKIDDCHTSWLTVDETHLQDIIRKTCFNFSITKYLYLKLFDYYFKRNIGKNYLILSNPLDLPTDSIFRIEIARGCSFNCSYCAIRKSVGNFHSKPFEDCIKEFEKGLDQGFKTIYITAPDPGCYGTDINTTYPELLKKIISFKGECNICLDGLNPVWLVRYIDDIEKIVKSGKISAISIPIQSANNRILKLMNRYSDVKKITISLLRIRKASQKMTISTGCIVGFPGETKKEFKDTLRFIIKIGFDIGFINPVSIKQNTKAETIEPKISSDEINSRIKDSKKYLKYHGYKVSQTKTGGIVFGKKSQ